MNHLGDTNKMVRECVSNEQVIGEATPNEELRRQILSPCVAKNEREWWASRTIEKLERELNAANESFRKLNIHTLNLVDRIKQLEEALDTFTCVVILTPMKWNRALQEAFDMARAVLKAKEDKP